jgi:hypothetical protein
MKMRYIFELFLLMLLTTSTIVGQNKSLYFYSNPNIFYSDPLELKKSLKKKHTKITIEVVYFNDFGYNKSRMPYIFSHRTIEFKGDSVVEIKDKQDNGRDCGTYKYIYDQCGNLLTMSSEIENIRNIYQYEGCNIKKQKFLRQINRSSDFNSHTTIIYNTYNQVIKEEYFHYPDTINPVNIFEYEYKDTLLTRKKEFTYSNGIKIDSTILIYTYFKGNISQILTTKLLLNKNNKIEKLEYLTKYSKDFPGKLDYIENEFGKIEYKYNLYGWLVAVIGGRAGQYKYSYGVNQEPNVVVEGFEGGYERYYFIKYDE